MQELEQAIRERAYHLWVADGRRDGNAETHWLVAQREVLATSIESFGRVTVSDTASSPTKSEKKPAAKGKDVAKKRRRAA